MHDSFEFREDAVRAAGSVGCPRQVCAVKWDAAKRCIEFARERDPALARLLDQVEITPDFDPSPVSDT